MEGKWEDRRGEGQEEARGEGERVRQEERESVSGEWERGIRDVGGNKEKSK